VGQKLGKCTVVIEKWSAKFDWPARVQAHASHLAAVERTATEALTRVKAAEWVMRQETHREEEWKIRGELLEMAREAIARWKANEKRCGSLEGIARLLELASKLGRLASGMATDKTEVSGEVDVNFRMEIEAAIKKVYAEPAIDVESVPNLAPREIGGGK
jgi:hypothetical protein